jgi:hypothetical protein
MLTKRICIMIVTASAALAGPSLSNPAFAGGNQRPGFDTCYALSVERGSGPDKGGDVHMHEEHERFMHECMAGEIPSTVGSAPSRGALARSSAAEMRHIRGHSISVEKAKPRSSI